MKFLNKVVNFFNSITKRDLIFGIIIVLLIGSLSMSISRCSDINTQYKNNIAALQDTIHYYKDVNGNLVATKLAFESDLKTLKLLNKDLYGEIKDLKAKGNITNTTYFRGVIENEVHDTVYVVSCDTITRGFVKNFAFNNDYRILEGNVSYKNDNLGVNIEKDQVKFDYIVVMDDKNNIMIKSTNPYVKYNEITGFQIPKQKQKRWSLGPAINFGYDPLQNKVSTSLGISLNYGIIQW